jgi:protein O-GlcNAc transferase
MDSQFQQAARLHQAGNIAEASRLYRQILTANPRHFQALCSLAFLHFQSGGFAEAEHLFTQAIAIDPDDPNALCVRGVAQLELRRPLEALGSFDAALALQPDFVHALINRATAFLELGRTEDALRAFDEVLTRQPQLAQAWNNRGNALLILRRPEDALISYDRALALAPDLAQAWSNRGNALAQMKRLPEAVTNYDQALTLAPNHLEAWVRRGEALNALWRFKDGLTSFDRADAVAGGKFEPALAGRAESLYRLGRYDEAARAADALLKLAPDFPYAAGLRTFARLCACDWRFFDSEKTDIAAGLRAGKPSVNPWTNIVLSDSPAEQLLAARNWASDTPSAPALARRARRHERIRIAYLSSDFRVHVTAHLMAGVLEQHDRARFETYGVAFGRNDRSPMRARLEAGFTRFIDAAAMSDGTVAELLRGEEIDIAIDLKGYTTDSRPGILAQRAAPVQVSYLGFAGTMGADHIDYLIADDVAVPQSQRSHYSESIVYLPDCYFPYGCTDPLPAGELSRNAAGLPEKGFVFCSLNNSYKLTPETFDLWMSLLRQVPGSVLWLLDSADLARGNLRREAQARGIEADRIVFAPFLPMEEHRARYRLADVFLDTRPCNAHTTAADALWAGVPVITWPGDTFASRVAASLLRACGLPELIVSTRADYEALALRFAHEPAALAAVVGKLARNRERAPLFDGRRLCRHLEAGFVTMQERYLRGEPPSDLRIDSQPMSGS